MAPHSSSPHLLIDAGVGGIRLQRRWHGQPVTTQTLGGDEFREILTGKGAEDLNDAGPWPQTFITGKLAQSVRDSLEYGVVLLPDAVLWAGAEAVIRAREYQTLAVCELSASGYRAIGVDRAGRLVGDLLVSNPRCGAGSGINLDRVLQKLAVPYSQVDVLLAEFLGEAGKKDRQAVPVRADRCGVFSVSATISDKNQGIPLYTALAVTLKSEVLKSCKQVPAGFDGAILTGGVFCWRYARDCAQDYLTAQGIGNIEHDEENDLVFRGIERLTEQVGHRLVSPSGLNTDERSSPELRHAYPALRELKREYTAVGLYHRTPGRLLESECTVSNAPILLALDVGSTMAKAVIATGSDARPLRFLTYSNHGDTIETVKQVFRDLATWGMDHLQLQGVGITGSARYQVRQVLQSIYPALNGRISVQVENIAHGRGAIQEAELAIEALRRQGCEVDGNSFVVVDIGGEDTKISRVSLARGDLIDNAMNIKCSAGTGSLMDTLAAMFGIPDIGDAYAQALEATGAFAINATCAVFLMESVRKLQVQGAATGEILASATWAIVENMARTLWSRLELPPDILVMLHGQPMRAEALPLAVTHRLQSFAGGRVWCRVPEHPGHRACLGLLRTLARESADGAVACDPALLTGRNFSRRIVQCRGAVCGDGDACCNRVLLKSMDSQGNTQDSEQASGQGGALKVTLGGCSAVNEWQHQKRAKPALDVYKRLWKFTDDQQSRSDDPERVVIPRSFAVSEWAAFIARIFAGLGLPVHVDNIERDDIPRAQASFRVDTCAPHIGAVGQYLRLASQPHGIILAPQLTFLPVPPHSPGRTCTLNQGGIETARNLAENAFPDARFVAFALDLKRLDAQSIARQLHLALPDLFRHYGIAPTPDRLIHVVDQALAAHIAMRESIQDQAANLLEEAMADGRRPALVLGREYILNPGIYDSHIGQLLRDKGVAAIPAHILDLEPEPEHRHIYWRNPQIIATLSAAANRRTLHQCLRHPRLRELFHTLESDAAIPLVQVTTFRCGPDSVIAPLIAELTREHPPLLIQSDAVIQELAHLESRVDTYIKQLGLPPPNTGDLAAPFSVKRLERFEQLQAIDPERDILYLATCGDNRALSAIARAVGMACVDHFDDDNYDLEGLVRAGRDQAGDAVCSPLAAMYGDLQRAVADFERRKALDDPLVRDKKRLIFVDLGGKGPCRLGQYCHVHKILAWREFGSGAAKSDKEDPLQGVVLQFMVLQDENGYDSGLPEWAQLRAFQGVVLHGVLDAMFFAGGARCRTREEHRRFEQAHRNLKQISFDIMEHKTRPGVVAEWLVAGRRGRTLVGTAAKYYAYGLHRRDLARELSWFADRWIRHRDPRPGAFRIHVDGEVYVRTTQALGIYRALQDALGYGGFVLGCTPVWSFFEYLIAISGIRYAEQAQGHARDAVDAKAARAQRRRAHQWPRIPAARQGQRRSRIIAAALRRLLAAPLYRAGGVPMPEPMSEILETAREILPNLHPQGELAPYVGEALIQLRQGTDLFLNVAPEGCMVSTMGETLTPRIMAACPNATGRIQHLFSNDGEIDTELLVAALLKGMGPGGYYGRAGGG
uniref:BadF/BadG/BcrA/BcrD ATPase family protein n=1 Tax=Candidatus Kentrum sp. DK TaxID=2126562 RepID=A0A450RYD3_9GAMM|nr:MAG: BadF/BadG/BcrA/BcrD ATPase family protein [Candidatus Kentron sp. DK]